MAAKKAPIRRHLKKVEKTTTSRTPPKTVMALKKQYHDLPLHFLFGIEREIDLQCPTLNEQLDKLKLVKEKLQKIRDCANPQTAKIYAAEALFQLEDLYEEIDEGTRGNFEKLRSSHEQWKRLAIRAINDTGKPTCYISV